MNTSTAGIEIGNKFSRWTVVAKSEPIKYANRSSVPMWLCKCDCGEVKKVRAIHLQSGRSGSCGCLHKEVASKAGFKHGDRKTPMYEVWTQMIQRCENPNNKAFKNYGGRGIKVCDKWHDYKHFLADMGPTYRAGLTIDRADNNGNYEPKNCRWITNKENCRNQRDTVRVEWDGVQKSLNEVAELHGVKPMTAYSRYRVKGWTLRQSLGLDAPPKKPRQPITEATRQLMSEARLKFWKAKNQ